MGKQWSAVTRITFTQQKDKVYFYAKINLIAKKLQHNEENFQMYKNVCSFIFSIYIKKLYSLNL